MTQTDASKSASVDISTPSQLMEHFNVDLLTTELVGFSPQLLIDDLTNISHDDVKRTLEAIEAGVRGWIDIPGSDILPPRRVAYLAELEKGGIALQTLIDSHSDRAFDIFEAWCWRNIFNVPPDLPIVAPHHKGLDLGFTEKQENEMRAELEMLKNKLEATKRLEELYVEGIKASAKQRARAEQQLNDLKFLSTSSEIGNLPTTIVPLFEQLENIPNEKDLLPPAPVPTPERPMWAASHAGFLTWGTAKAIQDLHARKPSELNVRTKVGGVMSSSGAFLERGGDADMTDS